jgi:hypothetical protein
VNVGLTSGRRPADDQDMSTDHTDRAVEAIAVLREALAETAAALAADERRVDGALADYLDRAAA